RTSERQCILGEGLRLLQAASQHLCFPQGKTTERLKAYSFHRCGLLQRLREQWHSVGDALAQSVHRPQGCSYPGGIGREVRVLTDAHGPFESGECLGQVALAEG